MWWWVTGFECGGFFGGVGCEGLTLGWTVVVGGGVEATVVVNCGGPLACGDCGGTVLQALAPQRLPALP